MAGQVAEGWVGGGQEVQRWASARLRAVAAAFLPQANLVHLSLAWWGRRTAAQLRPCRHQPPSWSAPTTPTVFLYVLLAGPAHRAPARPARPAALLCPLVQSKTRRPPATPSPSTCKSWSVIDRWPVKAQPAPTGRLSSEGSTERRMVGWAAAAGRLAVHVHYGSTPCPNAALMPVELVRYCCRVYLIVYLLTHVMLKTGACCCSVIWRWGDAGSARLPCCAMLCTAALLPVLSCLQLAVTHCSLVSLKRSLQCGTIGADSQNWRVCG